MLPLLLKSLLGVHVVQRTFCRKLLRMCPEGIMAVVPNLVLSVVLSMV